MRWLPFRWRLHIHRWVYQLSGGRLMSRGVAAPILLLTTRGRRSGKTRTWPLSYLTLEAGDDEGAEGRASAAGYVVVASNGGQARHPGWYWNLDAEPRVRVRVGGRAEHMRAHRRRRGAGAAVGAHAGSPGYARYQEGTTCEIPVVVLEPDAG
jgi:deazaflavin-dependent oxidoreductase (nitroreductase family)